VGHAICGNVLLEFREKVEGALTALLTHASHSAFRLTRAQGATSELGDLAALLISQFLDVVTAYASSGRAFRYAMRKSVGSLVGGKLDITRSIQLRARGLGHLLAFEKNTITFSTPVNRVISTALAEVEHLARLVKLPERVVATSRGLSMLFADCKDHETLYRVRPYFAAQASALAETERVELVRDMMSLASIVLAHESFDPASGQSTGMPRTWFLNLEKLFEAAVRNVMAKLCGDGTTVYRGSESPKAIFSKEKNEYRANPDIVIAGAANALHVGDVKYKPYDGSASSGDVYQLLTHAEAFEAQSAFLIFPGDTYSIRNLGVSRGGIETTFFSIRVQHLQEDLAAVVAYLGYPFSISIHPSAVVAL
jgi:5-methylcytosine-specific restriction endonuclease McrBC regulatory subunit McrC